VSKKVLHSKKVFDGSCSNLHANVNLCEPAHGWPPQWAFFMRRSASGGRLLTLDDEPLS